MSETEARLEYRSRDQVQASQRRGIRDIQSVLKQEGLDISDSSSSSSSSCASEEMVNVGISKDDRRKMMFREMSQMACIGFDDVNVNEFVGVDKSPENEESSTPHLHKQKRRSTKSLRFIESAIIEIQRFGSKKRYAVIDREQGSFKCYTRKPFSIDEQPKWSLQWNHWAICDVLNDESIFYLYEGSTEDIISTKRVGSRFHIFKCPNGVLGKLKFLQVAEYLNSEIPPIKKLIKLSILNRRFRTRNSDKETGKHQLNKLAKGSDGKAKQITNNEVSEVKAHPEYAYPHRWFTVNELMDEMNKPSEAIWDLRQDDYTSSEPIGYLFVEVLTCVRLPQSHLSHSIQHVAHNVTCSALLVCGKHTFTTDDVPHITNPIWLSRVKRSVIFPLYHAFGKLYVGVFHHHKNSDMLIGRVTIEISKLRPKTLYDAVIPLRRSGEVFEKKKRGGIRLRFELEWVKERSVILSYLAPSKEKLVTIRTRNDREFKRLAQLLHGESYHHLKYSNTHNRAVILENKLYRKEFTKFVKVMVVDICQWKTPYLSAYTFNSWMMSVYMNSMSLVLPFTLGFFLVGLCLTYQAFVLDKRRNLGFDDPNFLEMLSALVFDSAYGTNIKSLSRLNSGQYRDQVRNHTIFPYSEQKRDDIFRFSSFAESLTNKFYDEDEDKYKDENIERSDETVLLTGTYKSDFKIPLRSSIYQNQDINEKYESTAIKKVLWKMVRGVHAITGNVFKQEVYVHNEDLSRQNRVCKKALGITAVLSPLDALKSEYINPMIQIIYCLNSLYRLVFNLITWRDPILTFWFVTFLVLTILILLCFPWRLFLFLVGFLLFGPQNIILFRSKSGTLLMIKLKIQIIIEDLLAREKTPVLRSTNNENSPLLNEVVIGRTPYDENRSTYEKEVVVPYGIIKHERFYDWPPLSTGSKAKSIEANGLSIRFPPSRVGSKHISLTASKYS